MDKTAANHKVDTDRLQEKEGSHAAADALRQEAYDAHQPNTLPRPEIKGWEKNSSTTHVADPIGTAKIFDKDGHPVNSKNGKLGPGDYTIEFGDHRDFAMHVPNHPNGQSMYARQSSR